MEMVKLKDEMTEVEMEQYLIQEGFDIHHFFEGGHAVDSTKVSDIAIGEFGYRAFIDRDEILMFVRD